MTAALTYRCETHRSRSISDDLKCAASALALRPQQSAAHTHTHARTHALAERALPVVHAVQRERREGEDVPRRGRQGRDGCEAIVPPEAPRNGARALRPTFTPSSPVHSRRERVRLPS
eukprot:1000212-Prorocentrum_minimum.AAC.4